MKSRKYFCFLFLIFCAVLSYAKPVPSNQWFRFDSNHQVHLTVDLFLSSTCLNCQHADNFFSDMEKNYPWLTVQRHLVNQDKSALRDFYKQLQIEHEDNFFVPAIFFCDSHWSGFVHKNNSGALLMKNIQYCRQKIMEEGTLTDPVVRMLRHFGMASQILSQMEEMPKGASFLTIAALTDAFASCNLFCLATFVCFLWLLPRRPSAQMGGGLILIATIGALHYWQQTYASVYYQNIPGLMLYTIVMGLALLMFSYRVGFKSMRQTLVIGVLTLAMVYYYQQTCALNVAFIFTQWLAEQPMGFGLHGLYELAYQVCYLIPLFVMLCIWGLLSRCTFMDRLTPKCVLISRVMLMYIGVLLLVYPPGFSTVWVFGVVFIASMVSAFIYALRQKQSEEDNQI